MDKGQRINTARKQSKISRSASTAVGARPKKAVRTDRLGKAEAAHGAAWSVVDDWSDAVPVARAEIEALELYLGDLLDEILGDGHAPG